MGQSATELGLGLSGNGRDTKVSLWRRLLPSFLGGHAPCSKCNIHVEFSGKAPGNPYEELIKKIVGGRHKVPIHWLEDHLAEALYRAEVHRGAWAVDVGMWGPAAFRAEAERLVEDMRPEFGYLTPE